MFFIAVHKCQGLAEIAGVSWSPESPEGNLVPKLLPGV